MRCSDLAQVKRWWDNILTIASQPPARLIGKQWYLMIQNSVSLECVRTKFGIMKTITRISYPINVVTTKCFTCCQFTSKLRGRVGANFSLITKSPKLRYQESVMKYSPGAYRSIVRARRTEMADWLSDWRPCLCLIETKPFTCIFADWQIRTLWTNFAESKYDIFC